MLIILFLEFGLSRTLYYHRLSSEVESFPIRQELSFLPGGFQAKVVHICALLGGKSPETSRIAANNWLLQSTSIIQFLNNVSKSAAGGRTHNLLLPIHVLQPCHTLIH
ncbi:hypothetical protein AVEN_259376-1 [Araneus ventricosus]|uniref:Uncharacterized protein n=1 Tax=Araneus ventricosus TaxID=182803 RepID=A0A4Y2DTX2_ARAVE|nr:hypothetical protein AVEN_259376-1 [Araneus ventricosus]